jgi:phosphate transport system substrate-binding protein
MLWQNGRSSRNFASAMVRVDKAMYFHRTWLLILCAVTLGGHPILRAASVGSGDKISLVGSGSNVPSRLYAAWTDQYNKQDSTIQVRYLSMSTLEGIHQIAGGSGDFAAGEVPLTAEQMRGEKVKLTQIPTVLVGIVPIYKLPGNPELRFSGEVLAQIFMGTIKNWKDQRIVRLNPDTDLPDLAISVVHRSSGKGSNYIFTDFLSKTSHEFATQVGKSASPLWPVGVEANRGEDMADKVSSSNGAIGYVELNFARRGDLGYGSVQNSSGNFVRASAASITAACTAMEKAILGDFGVSLTNAPGKDSYPISSFTWIYLPVSGIPATRIAAVKEFLAWALHDGQNIAQSLGYAILTPTVISKARTKLDSLR